MNLQINVHRSMNYDTLTRERWNIEFHDYKGFATVKIQCGSDTVTFFDDDMDYFMNTMLAAWDEFNGQHSSFSESITGGNYELSI